MPGRWRRWTLAALMLASAAALSLPAVRNPILRAVGRTLVLDEPLEPSDAVVVVLDGDRGSLIEAADLVRTGISGRVALLADPPTDADRELSRRGVPFEDDLTASIRILSALGIWDVERIPKSERGTEEIGRVLPEWCDSRGYGSIVFVTSPDHSRRTRRVLDRALAGRATRVRIRTARHSAFDPDGWWRTRDGVRTALVELQKLVLDLVRHPPGWETFRSPRGPFRSAGGCAGDIYLRAG